MPKLLVHRANEQRSIEYAPGESLLHILLAHEVYIENPCNGRGSCGKCGVIIRGAEYERSADEKRFDTGSKRLACMIYPKDDLEVFLDGETEKSSGFVNAKELPDVPYVPFVSLKTCPVEPPGLRERTSWKEMLEAAFGPFGHELLYGLELRGGDYTAVYAGDRAIAIRPGRHEENYSVAVDIGTTTVQLILVDTARKRIAASRAFVNPQKDFGLDVITRISYISEHPDGIDRLSSAIRKSISKAVAEMAAEAKVDLDDIYEIVVSANTAMEHIFMAVPPDSIGRAPYAPVFKDEILQAASFAGLQAGKFTRLYVLPSVSAYIGADIVSGALATDIDERPGNVLFIDIGTNGEIILKQGAGMIATSCAAGPALEGMNISCGMRAQEGAVRDVVLNEATGEFSLDVIGGGEPKGICGSGLLGAIAEMLRVGLVDKNGRMVKESAMAPDDVRRGWLGERGGKAALCLGDAAFVTKSDIRSVQLSKTAILSGVVALLENAGLTAGEVGEYIVAGQFGKHLTEDMLVRTGLLPQEARGRITYAGNTSMKGALKVILNGPMRKKLSELSKEIEFLELSTVEGYDKLFVRTSYFPSEE